MTKALTLIAPEIAPAWRQAIAERSARWPLLARLGGRGAIRELPAPLAGLRTWQSALLDALGIHEHAEYPSAAVMRSGDASARAPGYWLQLQPMHFSAGLDRLTAVMLHGANGVVRAELAELEPTIAAHLRTVGMELVTTSQEDWLVHSERALDLRTATPESAVASPLEQAMPQGRDAGELRRLMTELQMLLHDHPVNVARLRRGVPEVNAVWFHGAGEIRELQRYALPQAFGDDLYLQGIYRLNDATVTAAPPDAQATLARLSSRAVVVVAVDDLDVLEAAWVAPLTRALTAGAIAQLDLVLDQWRVTVKRPALLKFWRSSRDPAQWVAC
ncbi:MAG TPA: hypothetical protein VJQ52_15505 [Steroidobacteraceae bacterium]|nr:hypothetical protein [Steroidobacteraceae bacterium]